MMGDLNQIQLVGAALESCLKTLDNLGLVAAAAFVDSAINALPKNGRNRENVPTRSSYYNLHDCAGFDNLDKLIDELFGDIIPSQGTINVGPTPSRYDSRKG